MIPFLRLFLLPISILYYFIIKARESLYIFGLKKTHILPGKVISIGNIVAGGTGKSPVVISLAEYLLSKNKKVVVLTRGYKSGIEKNQFVLLFDGKIQDTRGISGDIFPDEAMMQSQEVKKLHILVSPDRISAAKWYLEKNSEPDFWILDDGYQHLKIERNFNILLLDAQNPWGGNLLLPAGNLRETFSSIKRSTHVVFTRVENPHDIEKAADLITKKFPKKPIFQFSFSNDTPVESASLKPLDSMFSGYIGIVTAIANSEQFINCLKTMKFNINAIFTKPDHSQFESKEIIRHLGNSDIVITTSKDYWRNPDIFEKLPIKTYILPLKILEAKSVWKSILKL